MRKVKTEFKIEKLLPLRGMVAPHGPYMVQADGHSFCQSCGRCNRQPFLIKHKAGCVYQARSRALAYLFGELRRLDAGRDGEGR